MLLNLRSPWQTRGASAGSGGSAAAPARIACASGRDLGGQAVLRVGGDRLLEARQVARRIVDADAQADEGVVEPVDAA